MTRMWLRKGTLAWGCTMALACGGSGGSSPSGPELPPGGGGPGGSEPPPVTSSLVITVTTSGTPVDPDGYAVLVDGVKRGTVAANGTLTLSDVAVGAHAVTLDSAWVFCAFEGGTGRRTYDVNLVEQQKSTLTAAVTCEPQLRNRIIFGSNRTSMPQPSLGIWAMHPDGSGQTLLSPTEGGDFVGASLDGSQVAFIRATNQGGNVQQYLWVMKVDGSGARQVPTTEALPTTPRWSPDGNWIALGKGGGGSIWLLHPDGTGETTLDSGGYPDLDPNWSPDGTRLVYGHGADIYLMNADGTNRVALTQQTSGFAVTPAWSPDGSKIAFSSSRNGVYQIWVMNADGTGQTRLTQSTTYETNPAWSPDGSKIAWESERSGTGQDIWIMDADGSNQMSLTAGHGANVFPTWTR